MFIIQKQDCHYFYSTFQLQTRILNLSFNQIEAQLSKGEITCVALVSNYIKTIDDNKNLNAFLEVYADDALAQAKNVDEKIKNKTNGRLAGMVLGVKDVISHSGKQLRAASKILQGYTAPYTATALQRLLDQDAIVIGRLNCDEFAMGSSNENSSYGNVLNPLDNTKVPGGSSGGSAAAVTAGLCTAALGSDTGGSIRQPASFCGNIGFKPTYGRISRYGLIAYASSFDQIGTFTNTIEDAALLIEIMSGIDACDATSADKAVEKYSQFENKNQKYTIAYYSEALELQGLDPEIKSKTETYLAQLKEEGHTILPMSFAFLQQIVPVYYILSTAEASSNLARYDGVRYGYRSTDSHDLESTYKTSRSQGFGKEVKRRIMLGTFVLSSGYYEAYYTKAQQVRRLIHDQTVAAFQTADFILTPSTPSTAFAIGSKTKDPIAMYLADIYTVQANIVGLPAISLPLLQHSNGLPFGIQLMADKFQEKKLLQFSKQLLR